MKDQYNRSINYLRLSVTDRCNLRCVYCMEQDEKNFLPTEQLMTDEEIIRIVGCAATLGIKKIRLTGGEPLVRPGIVSLIQQINEIKGIEEIYLTTNGMRLNELAKPLKDAGVKGVNISLDSLNAKRFQSLTRCGSLETVLSGLKKCLDEGIHVKINTVLVDGTNEDEILDLIKLTFDYPVDLRFIELMPIGVGKKHNGTKNDEIKALMKKQFPDTIEVERDGRSGPAKYLKCKNSKGRVGFISPISQCFCGECNRIRITSDGFMKQCLHFDYGKNLVHFMRDGSTDEQLLEEMKHLIYTKPEQHHFYEVVQAEEQKNMNQIGG